VIRASDFADFVALGTAADAIHDESEALLAGALAEIHRLKSEAQAQIDAALAAAEAERKGAYDNGFQHGLDDAAAQWAQTVMSQAEAERQALMRQSERLGRIVSMAVEQMIGDEDRSALFQRALRSISRVVRDVPLLTLRVPEADCDSARAAVDAVLAHAASATPIEVVGDRSLAPGSCLFETDQGTIDASLDTQLGAIRRAVERTMRRATALSDAELDQTEAQAYEADDSDAALPVRAHTEAPEPSSAAIEDEPCGP
jgi:type III secretion protein L